MSANPFKRRRSLLYRGLLLFVVMVTFLHLPPSPATAEHDHDGPTASFVIEPQYPASGKSARFVATAEADDDATIVFYRWQFGDGTGAFGDRVKHRYVAPAESITVRLTVLDSNDRQTVVEQTIEVLEGGAGYYDAKMVVERPVRTPLVAARQAVRHDRPVHGDQGGDP